MEWLIWLLLLIVLIAFFVYFFKSNSSDFKLLVKDINDSDNSIERLFGKKAYKIFIRVIQILTILGIIGSVASYLIGLTPKIDFSFMFLIMFLMLLGIVIAALIRGTIRIVKYIKSHWQGISDFFILIICGAIAIPTIIILFFLFMIVINWLFGDCSGHVDVDHVHFERY